MLRARGESGQARPTFSQLAVPQPQVVAFGPGHIQMLHASLWMMVSGGTVDDRWRTGQGRLLAEEVLATLVADRDLHRLRWPEVARRHGQYFAASPPERLARGRSVMGAAVIEAKFARRDG